MNHRIITQKKRSKISVQLPEFVAECHDTVLGGLGVERGATVA
jgi:hypothetical protein